MGRANHLRGTRHNEFGLCMGYSSDFLVACICTAWDGLLQHRILDVFEDSRESCLQVRAKCVAMQKRRELRAVPAVVAQEPLKGFVNGV